MPRQDPQLVLEQTPTPTYCSDSLKFTATLTPASATGTVELLEGASSLATQSLSDGQASFTLAPRTGGPYPGFTVRYSGDAAYTPQETLPLEVVVSARQDTTRLASSQDPQQLGQSVTFTATVTPAGTTGTVDFYDGANLIDSRTLDAGVASVSLSTLTLGDHEIKAVHRTDDCSFGSESGVFTQHIINNVVAGVAESRPAGSSDDAEESASGSVSLGSSDLEFMTDGSRQRAPCPDVVRGAERLRSP